MKEILTVSQLNDNIKFLLEETFPHFWVEGEVSNLRRPQSGHVYFTLKDDKSQIRAVSFRQYGVAKKRMEFELEEGLHVLCSARLGVYQVRGEYQLIVDSVEPRGIGALQKMFEQLKAKLAAEGLFDECHKKAIPFLPQKIGVVTSPTGAVIRDILNVTKRRFPSVNVLIAPVRVQGSEAAAEIIHGLRNLQARGDVDLIIIARGGGSLEDLAPFNDELLAREIFSSSIPVISAVGHETDFTICDFVADLRAPTPSAAAELVVPDARQLASLIAGLEERLTDAVSRLIDEQKEQIIELRERFKDPRRLLADLKIHLDDIAERLSYTWRREKQVLGSRLEYAQRQLQRASPARQINERRSLLTNVRRNMNNNYSRYMTVLKDRLHKDAAMLNTLSPLNVLQRGYSITSSLTTGAIIKESAALQEKEMVNVKLAQGSFQGVVEKIFRE
jgi:exodeoxyribonuclease VII large subunit